jgi:hypothetical protein
VLLVDPRHPALGLEVDALNRRSRVCLTQMPPLRASAPSRPGARARPTCC